MHPSLRHHALERRTMDEREFRGPRRGPDRLLVEQDAFLHLQQIRAAAKIVVDTYDYDEAQVINDGDMLEAVQDLRKLIYPDE
jgi:hypothetical protein